jgi:hypothetical protein
MVPFNKLAKINKSRYLLFRMKDQRLTFAMEYWDWGIEEWKKGMYSD